MRGNTTAKNNGSDTESGEECEIAQQKNSCLQFNMFMQNIPLMDRELSHVCASVCEVFFRHLTGNGVGHHTICIEPQLKGRHHQTTYKRSTWHNPSGLHLKDGRNDGVV